MRRARLVSLLLGCGLGAASCRDFSAAESSAGGTAAAAGQATTPDGRGSTSAVAGGASAAAGAAEAGAAPAQGGARHGSAGEAQTSSAAGAGGHVDVPGGRGGHAEGGAGGEPGATHGGESGGDEPAEGSIDPQCKLYDAVSAKGGVGLGIAPTWFRSAVSLYTWDPSKSVVMTRWSTSLAASGWFDWVCLDVVPKVSRLTAMNLPNGRPELFASTTSGELFVRREFPQTWGPWLPFSLPTQGSALSDVDAVGGVRSRVYAVDRGRVYVREKLDDDSYSDYGPWQGLARNGSDVLAALLRADSSQLVVTVNATGQVATARQAPGAQDFDEWTSLPALPDRIIDLVVTEPSATELTIHALGASGTLWSLAGLEALDWAAVEVDVLGVKVEAIAGRSQGGFTQLFAIDASGTTYRLLAGLWLETT